MPYQVTLNSKNVLVPLALEDGHGQRLMSPLAKHDAATAMVIKVSTTGAFQQEFFPLKIVQDQTQAYTGAGWELWVQKLGGIGIHTYYLGIPNSFFSNETDVDPTRSLSVQVVGTSPMTGREDFSGGVDITLHAQVAQPLIPGFLNLGERFFPTLLPENFIQENILERFEFKGKSQVILMSAIHVDPADRIPVSLEKHWEAKNWIQAVVENLTPSQIQIEGQTQASGRETPAYFTIRGGCFCSRNRKISHWFGGRIGLDEADFRIAASEKIKSMGSSGNGSWVFWLEPQGAGASDADFNKGPIRISIRHPMLHRLFQHKGGRVPFAATESHLNPVESSLAGLSLEKVVQALGDVAQILVRHQQPIHQARHEPAHATWSKLSGQSPSPLQIFGEGAEAKNGDRRLTPRDGLEADIRVLYQNHGEILRDLESLFDLTYGYSAWDAVGNPLRETLSRYLAEGVSQVLRAQDIR